MAMLWRGSFHHLEAPGNGAQPELVGTKFTRAVKGRDAKRMPVMGDNTGRRILIQKLLHFFQSPAFGDSSYW